MTNSDMSDIQNKLSTKLILKLIDMLSANLNGEFDGKPLESVSIKATGRRFVIKGWLNKDTGPAIRFSAPWGDIGNGYLLYQPDTDSDWEDAEETAIDLDVEWEQASLVIEFDLENNAGHRVVFTGHPQ